MPRNKEEWKVYKNVFSEFSLRTLFKLSSEGHFEELIGPIALGKEANIFTARTKDEKVIIIKIYRLENCNFNQMYSYIKTDPRYMTFRNHRRSVIFAWTQREFKNLLKAREKIRVPSPITYKNNILLMEQIGEDEPAPMLKDKMPKNTEEFLKKIIYNMQKLLEAGIVHGDLSEFNILNYKEEPVFIDFSQATLSKSYNAKELFERDKQNIQRCFQKVLGKEKTQELLLDVSFQ